METMTEKTDQELIGLYLQTEDEVHLHALISRYIEKIHIFVSQFTKNEQDADDVTQEVFVKVWKNLAKYDERKNFKAWIFTIAKNTALDWQRKRRAVDFSQLATEESENFFAETIFDTTPLPHELAMSQEDAYAVREALARLPLRDRTIISMRHMEDLTFKEMGKILKKPLNTIKSRYRRALETLRKNAPNLSPKSY